MITCRRCRIDYFKRSGLSGMEVASSRVDLLVELEVVFELEVDSSSSSQLYSVT